MLLKFIFKPLTLTVAQKKFQRQHQHSAGTLWVDRPHHFVNREGEKKKKIERNRSQKKNKNKSEFRCHDLKHEMPYIKLELADTPTLDSNELERAHTSPCVA